MKIENREFTDWQLMKYALLNTFLLFFIFFAGQYYCTGGLACAGSVLSSSVLMLVTIFITPLFFLARFGARGVKNYFFTFGVFFGVFAISLLSVFLLFSN